MLIAAVCGLGAASALAVFVTSYDGQNAAQGWFLDAGVRAWRASAPDAHRGRYVLRLGPGQITTQPLDLPADHPAYDLTFQIWLRPAAGFPSGQTDVTIDARGGVITATRATFSWTAPSATWQPVTATATLPAGIPALRLALIPTAGVEADDASRFSPERSRRDGATRERAQPIVRGGGVTTTAELAPRTPAREDARATQRGAYSDTLAKPAGLQPRGSGAGVCR